MTRLALLYICMQREQTTIIQWIGHSELTLSFLFPHDPQWQSHWALLSWLLFFLWVRAAVREWDKALHQTHVLDHSHSVHVHITDVLLLLSSVLTLRERLVEWRSGGSSNCTECTFVPLWIVTGHASPPKYNVKHTNTVCHVQYAIHARWTIIVLLHVCKNGFRDE